ncbi:G protein-coupled glucose receptor regulating Gpa2-domain-containing protein [Tuber brumale]|nr:G protein-coupled glucose receptor regulating Gpa2-domain-containing protein [Tuber brumale]
MRLSVSVLSLIGSSLSALGTGFICLCYLFLPLKAHFRHRLIQNLAVSYFLNALSNSASGFYILTRDRELPEGIGCRMNGLVTQITVQATDLSILAIAIVTVWAITAPTTFGLWSTRKAIIAVCFIWVIPFTTGFTAFAKDWYHPVSGNWCWIQSKPAYLRYALTHAWRFFVIISVIVLYTHLHLFLRKHFKEIRSARSSSLTGSVDSQPQPTSLDNPTVRSHRPHNVNEDSEDDDEILLKEMPVKPHDRKSAQFDPSSNLSGGENIHTKTTMEVKEGQGQQGQSSLCPQPTTAGLSPTGLHRETHTRKPSCQGSEDSEKKLKKVLLMRAYPTFYVILVIPGIANRLVEASGGSSRVLQLMQASTQFVGLANAITYGWNESILVQLKKKFCRMSKSSPGPNIV